MSEEILHIIYNFSKKYNDPINNLPLDQKNQHFSVIIKDNNVNISLTTVPDKANYSNEILKIIENFSKKIKGVLSVNTVLTSERPNKNERKNKFNINSKQIIAIASGKGGVGKSTFAVNLAGALSKIGEKVGLLDADIYGPSIPKMIGITKKPEVNENNKLIPLENYGIKCMSIGFLLNVDTPAIWRGPMVMKALENMFDGVDWGKLDFLIIDLPPGTGDVQLSLAQSAKLSGSIIVSTPQDIALIDVRKGINMFNKVNIPILGLVENMSYFVCDKCNEKHFIFSNEGAKKEAEKNQIPFLGSLPLSKDLRIKSDKGKLLCIDDPEGEMAQVYFKIAKLINKFSEN